MRLATQTVYINCHEKQRIYKRIGWILFVCHNATYLNKTDVFKYHFCEIDFRDESVCVSWDCYL